MVYIIYVPAYYQSSSYSIIKPKFPTSNARYWLVPSDNPFGRTVYEAARAWGWQAEYYNVPALRDSGHNVNWLVDSLNDPRHSEWLMELWEIWQREHGLRISQREKEMKKLCVQNMSSVRVAAYRLDAAGSWLRRVTSLRGSIEWQLRKLEERKSSVRNGEQGQR